MPTLNELFYGRKVSPVATPVNSIPSQSAVIAKKTAPRKPKIKNDNDNEE